MQDAAGELSGRVGLEAQVVGAETALRKARRRVVPLLGICYLVAYMDRANISFAAEAMNRQLHFSATVYGLGAGLFFLSYAALEVPANALLLRLGARRWLAGILMVWGLLAMGMLLVRGRASFYTVRLLLGAAEAGYFPGAMFYLSQWFPAAQRAKAISWFYISLPLGVSVMGALAETLLRMDGKLELAGWQWLFLVEGLPAVALSGWVWFGLPDGPESAKWLCAEERAALAEEMAEQKGTQDGGSKLELLGRIMRSGSMLRVGGYYCLGLTASYAMAFFNPTILRQLTGWTMGEVGYLVAGSGVVAAVVMVATGTHSDRMGERKWHIVVPSMVMVALLLFAAMHLRGWGAAVALLAVFPMYCAIQGPQFVVISTLWKGEAAALGIAAMNMYGITGGFLGPYVAGWLRDRTGGYRAQTFAEAMMFAVGAGLLVWDFRVVEREVAAEAEGGEGLVEAQGAEV